jgi:hypothetical protein
MRPCHGSYIIDVSFPLGLLTQPALWSVPCNVLKGQGISSFCRCCCVEMICCCYCIVVSVDWSWGSGFTGCTFVCDKHMFRFQLFNISSICSAEHYAMYWVPLYVSHQSQRHFSICLGALGGIHSSSICFWPPSHSSGYVGARPWSSYGRSHIPDVRVFLYYSLYFLWQQEWTGTPDKKLQVMEPAVNVCQSFFWPSQSEEIFDTSETPIRHADFCCMIDLLVTSSAVCHWLCGLL